MDNEVLVRVEGVSKKFCKSLKRSLWYGVQDISSELFGLSKKQSLRKDEFLAVNDVSFELRRGECLGLIGHNGAGKSTLLKMLNGLIKPDKGRIEMRGRVGALIELGTGFNPILTGRENVYNNAAVLGFTREEVDAKFEAILEFSEIGDFIDTPVQNYSSGMKVRLGFSVAAQLEPDILIIDEVLAVGDIGFRLKCYNLIDTLVENTAIIFVTHSLPQVSRLCSSIKLLAKGKSEYYGEDIGKGIELYYNSLGSKVINYSRTNDLEILEFVIKSENVINDIPIVNRLDDLEVFIHLKFKKYLQNSYLSLTIFDPEQRPVGICQDIQPLSNKELTIINEDEYEAKVNVKIPRINLSQGLYSFTFVVQEDFRAKPLVRLQSIAEFQIRSEMNFWPPVEFEVLWN